MMSTSIRRHSLKLCFSSNPVNLEAALDNLIEEVTIQEWRELSTTLWLPKADWLDGAVAVEPRSMAVGSLR